MKYVVEITGIVALGMLTWQDFRSRRIVWWLLPILAIVFFIMSLWNNPVSEIGKGLSLNIIFLCFQFLLVWIWFSVKNKKLSKIIDAQIGLGDILFLLCITIAFSPVNFLVFYTLGMICTLVVAIAGKFIWPRIKKEIPLAGALAIPIIGLFIWRMIDPGINFYNDEWLVQLLEK